MFQKIKFSQLFNQVFFTILILIFISVLYGCKTSPPVTSPEGVTGRIVVSSNIAGAGIFVNNLNTGKFTPDTLSLSPGNYSISLQKEGYQPASNQVTILANQIIETTILLSQSQAKKIVLMEDFSNISCVPCVTTNRIVESLKNYLYPETELAIIKYPTNFPSPDDPFYKANKPDNDERIKFYNVFSTPAMFIDGNTKPVATDSFKIKDAIGTRINLEPRFRIEITQTKGSPVQINIDITPLNTEGLNFSQLVLHTVVVEKEISFETPPGSNGEKVFHDVMRLMLPGNKGEDLPVMNLGNKYSFNRIFSINSSWQQDKLKTIVFIQNKITKEVYQAASINY